MNWFIEFTSPEMGSQRVELQAGKPIRIGRGSDSDTKIPDPALSRLHCEISVVGQAPLLTDLNSSAGTFFGAKKIEQQPLKAGDRFRAGSIEFSVVCESDLNAPTRMVAGTQPTNIPELIEYLKGKKKVDRFEFEELVNAGGQNLVYRAVEAGSNKKVALKIIPTPVANEEEQARFVRAMKMLQDINDKHLARLYRAGRRERYCWVAMEWFEQGSIADRAKRQGINSCLDWKDVWRVGYCISGSLVALEREGIVHRSIRPTNILFREKDKAWVLSDLVVAKAEDTAASNMVTRHQTFLPADLAYTAPERLLGNEANDGSIQADIYSLGAVLCELLTGTPPFGKGTLLEILPRLKEPRNLVSRDAQMGMNELFADLVNKLTDPDLERRIGTAAALHEEVKRVGMLSGIQVDS